MRFVERLSYVWILTVAVVAMIVPWLPLPDPSAQNVGLEHMFPLPGHLLGTVENGTDLAAQLAWGMRLSLGTALAAVVVSSVVGLVLGGLAGFRGGGVERGILVLMDTIDAFPGLLLIVALAAVLGPSPRNVVFVLVLGSWVGYARLARAQVLSIREEPYIEAARALGVPAFRRFFRHIVPQLLPSFLVKMTYGLSTAVLAEASLGFLGLGSPPGTPSWGQLLMQARDVLTSAPHALVVPGVSLTLTVFAANVIGDDLRDKLEGF